jgi:hypothetical protein
MAKRGVLTLDVSTVGENLFLNNNFKNDGTSVSITMDGSGLDGQISDIAFYGVNDNSSSEIDTSNLTAFATISNFGGDPTEVKGDFLNDFLLITLDKGGATTGTINIYYNFK